MSTNLNKLYNSILKAEQLFRQNGDKKEFVISCVTENMTAEDKAVWLPLLPVLIDFSVSLMKSPVVLGVRKKYGCV